MSQTCQTCGACCAAFRVSFYWAESDIHPQGRVPGHLTTPVSPYHLAMRGSTARPPRCEALEGEIGRWVGCTIYERRPSPCREFMEGEERCGKARHRHGLPPLSYDTPQAA